MHSGRRVIYGDAMTYTSALMVAIAALWFARSAYRSHLLARRRIREEDASNATQRRMLEVAMIASVQETARMAILHDLSVRKRTRN